MKTYHKLAIILSLALGLIGCGGIGTEEDPDSLPVARNDTATTPENSAAIGILVLANDTPNTLEGDTPSYIIDVSTVDIITPPENGSAEVVASTGEVKYLPNTDFSGTDSFVYTYRDMKGNFSNPATVTITVTPAPIITRPFKIKILISDLEANGGNFKIPRRGTGYNYNVDCNNDGIDEFTEITGSSTCNYSTIGEKIISISGTYPEIYFAGASGDDKNKLISIEQWGTGVWRSMNSAFSGCSQLEETSLIDKPNLSTVSDMSYMFSEAAKFNGDIGDWDVSNVTNMFAMFHFTTAFNQNIGSWTVDNVDNMGHMFHGATTFNQNIGGWTVNNVTNMNLMFNAATAFNQNIGDWTVDNVANMNRMFFGATAFNQNIGNWTVNNVTNMGYMFANATAFNQNIGNWRPEKVTDMSFMFRGASSFNQDIGNWTVGSVDNMYHMFNGAEVFNQDLKLWDVSAVTHMGFMFSNTKNFNQDIGSWTITNVEFMFSMFANAEKFNGDIGNWGQRTGAVKNMGSMFYRAKAFNQDLSNWDVSNVEGMGSMFREADIFDQDIGQWDVSKVTNMSLMFRKNKLSTINYDKLLNGWWNNLGSQGKLQSGVVFDAANSTYSAAAEKARSNFLIDTGPVWTINDKGCTNCPIE